MKLAIILILAAFSIIMANNDQPGPAGFLTDDSANILTGNNTTDELMAK